MFEFTWIDIARTVTLVALPIAAIYLGKSIIWFVLAGKRTIDLAEKVRRETTELLHQAEAEPLLPSNRRPRSFRATSVARRHLDTRAAQRARDLQLAD